MDSDPTKAQHYRDQAIQMRILAAAEPKATKRKRLIELSKMYDRLNEKSLQNTKTTK
jgi:hypothetical protein